MAIMARRNSSSLSSGWEARSWSSSRLVSSRRLLLIGSLAAWTSETATALGAVSLSCASALDDSAMAPKIATHDFRTFDCHLPSNAPNAALPRRTDSGKVQMPPM
jgi:hypothetical protein